MAKLVWKTSTNQPQTLTISAKGLTIGRHEENDLILSDSSVALRHAIVKYCEQSFSIQDLDSFIGITVNDRPVVEAPIQSGDRLGIGAVQVMARITGAILVLEETSDRGACAGYKGSRDSLEPLTSRQEPIARGLLSSWLAVIFTPNHFFSTLDASRGPAMAFLFTWIMFSFCGFFRIADFRWLAFFKEAPLLVGVPIFLGFSLLLAVSWLLIGSVITYLFSLASGLSREGENFHLIAYSSAPLLLSINYPLFLGCYGYANLLFIIGGAIIFRISWFRALVVIVGWHSLLGALFVLAQRYSGS